MRYINILSVVLIVLVGITPISAKKRAKSSAQVTANLTLEEKTRFNTFFYEAIRLKEDRKFDQALENFRLCESIDSVDGGLQSELGQMYAALNMPNEAVKATRKAYLSDTKNWWYGVNLVALYAALQQPQLALEITQNLQKNFATKEELYQIQSSLYKQLKQPEKAIQALDKLESIAGVDAAISMDKFNLYLELKQNKKAIAEIDKLSAKFPTDMRFKVLRGDIYMYQKLPEMAFQIYKQVEKAEPDNPYVYVSLSEYYKEKGDTETAKQHILKALKLDALEVEQKITILGDYVKDLVRDSVKLDETESLFKLLVERYPLEEKVYDYYAVFLQFRGRLPEANTMYETMLTINAKNTQTWLQMIQLRLQEQNFEALKTVTDRAIEMLPEVHQYYFFRAMAQLQLKDYTQALLSNNMAISLLKQDEKSALSDYNAQLGDVYYRMDSTDRTFETYEKALEANPSNVYVMNNYAYYLSEKSMNLKRAESLSAKTIEKEPKNSTYLDTYAWIFYQQGNYSLAKFYIERAIDYLDSKQSPGVVYDHYGDILLKNGNEKKALEIWKKAYETEKTDAIKKKIDEMTEKLSKNN